MVKKTSFLDKLKNRWRPASGMVVEGTARAGAPGGSTKVDGDHSSRVQAVAMPSVQSVSSRKLNPKQEAVVAINEGFKELSSLLRGMQTRIDDQGEQVGSAAESLGQLPALGQAQVDLMRTMIERMERQGVASEQLNEKLGDMPDAVAGLRESLEKAQATDQRTAATLDEFKSNMEDIQGAMAQIVEHSGTQASAASTLAHDQRDSAAQQTDAVRGMVDSFDNSHRATLSRFEQTTDASVQTLKRAQEQQVDRLRSIADGNRKATKTITGLLVVVVIALVAVVIVLAAK